MIPAQISAKSNSPPGEPTKGISQDKGDILDNLKNDPKSDISTTSVEMVVIVFGDYQPKGAGDVVERGEKGEGPEPCL
ncbi:hypothetical protein Tco_0781716, partial [Tanacetum coccineum]